MTLTDHIILIIFGLIIGFMIAAGTFAFLTLVGVITRLAIRTDTASKILYYEDTIVLGALVGNIITIFQPSIPVGNIGVAILGFFSGCFVGCLAMALEEVIQVFPIITYRMKLTLGIPFLIFVLAISKGVGAFIQLFFIW